MKKRSSHRWSVNKSVSGVGWVVWPPGCGPNRFDTFEDAWKFVSLRLSDPDANVICLDDWKKMRVKNRL